MPDHHDPARPTPTPGQLRGLSDAQIRDFSDTMKRIAAIYAASFRRMVEAFKPLLEWANSAEGRAFLARAELAAAARGRMEPQLCCRCLCGFTHPGESPCEGALPQSEITLLRFGDHDVPACPPCAALQPDRIKK